MAKFLADKLAIWSHWRTFQKIQKNKHDAEIFLAADTIAQKMLIRRGFILQLPKVM